MISGNNETIEICINDVVSKDMSEENPNVQIETNTTLENGTKKIMKGNLKKLHVQKKNWKPHGRTSLCWIFYCVNDNAKIDLANKQIMRCIFYYQNLKIGINPKTQMKKGLISYYKTNGIIFLLKHVQINLLLHKGLKKK
jgi:hypothetical protein